MSEVAYFSVVYPKAIIYLDEFLRSAQAQNGRSFNMVLVNDGVAGLEDLCKKYRQLNVRILKAFGSPSENRKHGLAQTKKLGYSKIVLADCDDFDAPNRLEVTAGLLDKYDIVVNDLDLVDQKSHIQRKSYFSSRLSDLTRIDATFIEDKNLFGFGNSAMRAECLDLGEFDSSVISADWLFFTLVLLKGKTAVFTNQTVTYHRLHEDNLISLGRVDPDALIKALRSKLRHYEYMARRHSRFKAILDKYQQIERQLTSHDGMNKYMESMAKRKENNLFWLEEIQAN